MRAGLGRSEIYLLLSGFLWGTSFVATKIGVTSSDPYLFALVRFAFGALVLVGTLLLVRRWRSRMLADRLVIMVSFFNAVAYALQNVGMTITTASNAALLININIGLVTILAALLLNETITKRILVGLGVGLLGVVIISTKGDMASIYQGQFVGDMLCFIAGCIWAFYIVYQKKILERERDVLMVTGAIILETALFMIPITLLFAQSYEIDSAGWITMIYAGTLCTGGAFLLYNLGLQKVKASISSIILLAEVVFGMLFAFLILGEMPGVPTAIGGALILIAIAVISFGNPNGNGGKKKGVS